LPGRSSEVLRLVALGRTNREVAHELFLAVRTVAAQSPCHDRRRAADADRERRGSGPAIARATP
jgi:FixJ family two-component response regulator